MILVLNNGDRVEINRHNCGYEWKMIGTARSSREWNIRPIELIAQRNQGKSGFFVIAKWGSNGGDTCEKMIPLDSVCYIEKPDHWED